MDLAEFVDTTLCQIVKGVHLAQTGVAGYGAELNPQQVNYNSASSQILTHITNSCLIQQIEFDVAVTVTADNKKQGGAGIQIAAFNLGGKAEHTTTNTSVSRIRFSVPVVLPPGGTPLNAPDLPPAQMSTGPIGSLPKGSMF